MRPDVFVKDDNQLIEELKIARELKLISLPKAIMQYQDVDEKEAEEEMRKIEEEMDKQSERESIDFNPLLNTDES